MGDFSFANLKPYSGLIIAIIGMGILLAAIFDLDYIFKADNKSFNLTKISGMVNFFGRNFTRFLIGASALLVVVFGLIWFWYDMTLK